MRRVRAYAPGRSELAGNHTDHQGGRVIAATLDCGVEVVAHANDTTRARVESAGFASVDIDVKDGLPRDAERFTTSALVRGVTRGLWDAGVAVVGFDAQVTSTVPPGSGLSSSAAFELALCAALELLFSPTGDATLSEIERARIGQMAERDYFGKPCGLMDQLSIALGGIVRIDFANSADPAFERIDFDFSEWGYALCLIDSHCDHSLYTEEYSQVAHDMAAVAEMMGAPSLSHVSQRSFLERFDETRDALGDAPALRALHFYLENHLVDERVQALRAGDLEAFLAATRRSSASSAQYLQNVSTSDRSSQPAMVALALADYHLGGAGACRIHGGGFGGSIQAFVPAARRDPFAHAIDSHLGQGSCRSFQTSGERASARWI